jgi:hypothetical protein
MPKLLTKFVFSLLAALITLFSVAPGLTVHAQIYNPTWYAQGPLDYYSKVYDVTNPSEIFGERYTAAQVQWVFYSVIAFIPSMIIGPKAMSTITCLFNFASGQQVDTNQCMSILTAGMSVVKPVAQTVAPPKQNLWELVFAERQLSGISYVRNMANDFSLVPSAKAQTTVGFGFDALLPVQAMWSGVRNIAFSFFVIIAVVFSFLIMFRVKLSPQTVVTVQSALPKIIVAIITVTFSYAIAGFLIDLMYVVIGLVSLMANEIFRPLFGSIFGPTSYFNFLTLGQPLSINTPSGVGVNVQIGVFGLLTFYITFFLISFSIVLALNMGLIGSALAVLVAAAIAVFAPVIAVFMLLLLLLIIVVAVIVAIIQAIKVLWTLLKAFVSILLLTIFAPVQLTLGILIPNFGLGAWIRSYLSALSTFVVTGLLILFSYIFLVWGVQAAASSLTGGATDMLQSFVTLMIGNQINIANTFFGQPGWPPLLGTGTGGSVGLLMIAVSFVIFTTIPKSAEMVQAFIQGKPFAYGTAVGEALGPVRWGGRMAYNETGMRDTWEIAQAVRKNRLMDKFFGSEGPLRPYAERFTGLSGDDFERAVDNALKRSSGTVGKRN